MSTAEETALRTAIAAEVLAYVDTFGLDGVISDDALRSLKEGLEFVVMRKGARGAAE